MRRRATRWAAISFLGAVAIVGLWLMVAAIVYSPTYVYRVLRMRESDQTDYLENFPVRTLEASTRPYHYREALDTGIEQAVAEVLGTDDLDTFLASTSTQAFIVIEDDRIVLERYANGAQRETMLTSFSVAKSFDSALIGIAIDEGLLGVDDSITEYLPELAGNDPDLSGITIGHLLSMSSGLAFEEMRWALFNGDDPLTTYHPDQREVSLEAATRLVDEPGRHFQYNKYQPQLLGMILERVTGMSVTEYTQARLWQPVGMEFDGQWVLDSQESGFEKMEAGLNARAIDFAKLGSLFLAGGEWNGSQIVSNDWVQASTSRNPQRDQRSYYRDDFGRWVYADGGGWYGYFWYGRQRANAEPDFFAEGDHGQFIYVSPSTRRIVVRMGTDFGLSSSEWIDAFYLFCGT